MTARTMASARCVLCSALLCVCIATLPAADASILPAHGTLNQYYFAQARQLRVAEGRRATCERTQSTNDFTC